MGLGLDQRVATDNTSNFIYIIAITEDIMSRLTFANVSIILNSYGVLEGWKQIPKLA